MDSSADHYNEFAVFVDSFHSEQTAVAFLHEALACLIDSDLVQHTDRVDVLLLFMVQHKYTRMSMLLDTFMRNTPYFHGYYLPTTAREEIL